MAFRQRGVGEMNQHREALRSASSDPSGSLVAKNRSTTRLYGTRVGRIRSKQLSHEIAHVYPDGGGRVQVFGLQHSYFLSKAVGRSSRTRGPGVSASRSASFAAA